MASGKLCQLDALFECHKYSTHTHVCAHAHTR